TKGLRGCRVFRLFAVYKFASSLVERPYGAPLFPTSVSLTFLVVRARAVDVRHSRTHRPHIRGKLTTVMDAVIVGEADVLHRRPVEIAETIDVRCEFVARQRAQRLQLFGGLGRAHS